jgi:hypothetical protein
MISPTRPSEPGLETTIDFNIDFIGIGTSKAGTTWISEMLDAHPGICMSEPKEVNYFNEQDNYYLNFAQNSPSATYAAKNFFINVDGSAFSSASPTSDFLSL